jgi:2-succinyl-6-hydroxy-2,4-cyclohexadiene-1-carboxylate synthase
MPYSVRQGVRTYYRSAGSGVPLVLLHGFTGSGSSWEPFLDALSVHYRVILPDIIGHGHSDSPAVADRYRIEQAADDVAALVDEPFLLLGYSMGGRLALTLADRYPHQIRALILESATAGYRSAEERMERRASDESLAERIEQQGLAWFVDYWGQLPLWANQSAAMRETLRSARLHNNLIGLANSLRGMGTGAMPSLWDRLALLTIPTLLLVGELDTKFTAINREMAQLLPQAQMHVIENAGHATHIEQPAAWLAQVQAFLNAQ